jgi:hypothetical protein
MTAQQADDQLRLGAAGNYRHRYRRAVHDRNSSAPGPAVRPLLAAWSHAGRPVAPVEDLGRDQSAVPAPLRYAGVRLADSSPPVVGEDLRPGLSLGTGMREGVGVL